MSPTYGSAAGNDTVTIYGTNFGPSFGPPPSVTIGPTSEIVQGVSSDGTAITILTRPVAGAVPTTAQDVTVTTAQGTVTLSAAFTYLEGQTPTLYVLTPNIGPLEGGTRVTITGTGFQYPVQVLFGTQQAQVVSNNFNQVVCISPSITASKPATGNSVDVTVTNVSSGKKSNALPFQYGQAMFISGITPSQAPTDVATTVTITGQGFVSPVSVIATVSITGVSPLSWTVLSVSGTQIVAKTAPIPQSLTPCYDVPAAIKVTNLDSNLSATGDFTYQVAPQRVTAVQIDSTGTNLVTQFVPVAVAPSTSVCPTPWSSHTVTIKGSGFRTGMTVSFGPVGPVPATFVDTGTLTLTLPDLTAVGINTTSCAASAGGCGTQNIPTPVNVTVFGPAGCSDTLTAAIIISPCDTVCHPTSLSTLTVTPVGTSQTVSTPFTVNLGFTPSPSSAPTTVNLTYVGFSASPSNTVIPSGVPSPWPVQITASSAGTGNIIAQVGSGACGQLTATSVPVTVNFSLTLTRSGTTNAARTISSSPL
ncbi:MAG: hypothetical protein B7X11_02695, partial [Acidobacteria bacterium 37-65-4]